MDDFFVFGALFELCMDNLDTVLKRCVETNLMLNLENCNFTVAEGIVLGYNTQQRIHLDSEKSKLEQTLTSS